MKISTMLSIFVALFLFMHGINAAAEEKDAETAAKPPAGKTVAVLPFEMHAPSSLAYLQDGLRDMLASRLASNGGAIIVERGRIDALLKTPGKTLQQKEGVELARQLAVDYVVSGSLTSLGGSMSLDAKVFSPEDAEPLSFYASAAQENEVLGAVDSLSWDIAEKLLGARRPASAMQPGAAQPGPAAEDPAMAAFRTEHPDKKYKSEGFGYGSRTGSPIIMSQSSQQGFSKTQNLDFSLTGMDVGDVDGDGQYDVVMSDISNVYVYKLQNNRLVEIGSVKMPNRSKIHAVSLGDTDEDGKAEIYVSAADDFHPYSWAYEWDGSRLEMILDNVSWYIRVLDIPGEGHVLLGQRGGQDSLLLPGIFRLMRNGTQVMPEERIIMPDYVNLFDFALADVTGDGAREIIAINNADRMYVIRPDGYVLWVSDDFYGGTSRYIGEAYELTERVGMDLNSAPSYEVDTQVGEGGKRIYIPTRLVIMDVNRDGISDVVVNKNLFYVRHMENYKQVKSGEIHAMVWNGIGLSDMWQTRKIDGYITDFQFLPIPDKENSAALFVGLRLSRGWSGTLTGGESTILTYDIELAEEKKAAAEAKN